MKYRLFEQSIKATLNNAEETVDIAQLWSSIQKEEKKKKPLFWWFFTGLLLLATGAAAWVYPTLDKPQLQVNPTFLDKDHIQNKQDNQPIAALVESNNVHDNPINNTNTNNPPANTQNYTTANFHAQKKSLGVNMEKANSLSKPSDAMQDKTGAESSGPVIAQVEQINRSDENILPIEIPARLLNSAHKEKINRDVQCPTFRKNRSMKLSLIPEIGYFKPFKSLTSETAVPSETFELRKADEKSLEGLQAALYARLQRPGSNWGISTGLQYTRLSEQMNLAYSYIRRDTSQGIISVTVSQTGDTITTIYGDIISETRVTGTTKAHYYLSTFDIPLSVFFEKDFNSFAIGGEAGVYFNLALASKGKILNTANDFIDVKSAAAFRSSIGVSGFAGIYVKKPLGIGNLMFSIRGRYNPSVFNTQGYGTIQKYQFIGAHLGYEIRF